MSDKEVKILLPWKYSDYITAEYYDRNDMNNDSGATIYHEKNTGKYICYGLFWFDAILVGEEEEYLSFHTLEEAKKYADEKLIEAGYKLLEDKHMSLL